MASVGVLLVAIGATTIITMAVQGLSPSDAWSEVKHYLGQK